MTHDFVVFIGRFRFFQNGHLAVMRRGLAIGRQIIVLVGSCRQARSVRNPLTFEEVQATILGAFDETERARISILPLMDRYDDVAWVGDVQDAVSGVAAAAGIAAPRICLIGHTKDQSSYYLRLFPQWAREDMPNQDGLSATPIREDYFADAETALTRWADALPANVIAFLRNFAGAEAYARLKEEAAFLADYRRQWAAAPYPPIFVTADAVVIQEGHVLLVERGQCPGKGLLALPGGFVEQTERIRHAMLRELHEETGLELAWEVLDASVTASAVFDYPYRSERGRTITHAFLLELAEGERPRVRGSDDASRAFWMPLDQLDPESLFDDHWHIIRTLLSRA